MKCHTCMKSRINVGHNNYDLGHAAFAKTIPLQNFTVIRFNFRLNYMQFLLTKRNIT